LLEDPAAVFVVFKLIEARTGRGQQNHVAGNGFAGGFADRSLERARFDHAGHPANLLFDLFRCRADGVNGFDPCAQQSMQLRVVRVFILPAEDQVNVTGKGGDGFRGRVHIGGFGIVVVIDTMNGGHEFQTMLDGVERCDGLANDSGG
jgi:hypothetical protein